MASTLAKPPTHQRQSSRPNSASSSSVVTVQRTPSFTSRNYSHPPISGLRAQSPTELNSIPRDLSGRTLSPESTKRRSSALYTRPESGHGLREGVGNLNRWSQSTASSKSSATHNRRGSFSRRLSGSFGSFSGFASAQTPSPNATFSNKVNSSPKKSPPRKTTVMPPPTNPPPVLPPIAALSSLSQAVDAADSPSTATIATPITADLLSPVALASAEPDYFGDRWKSRPPSNQLTGTKRPAPSASPRAKTQSPTKVDQPADPRSSGLPESLYSPRASARLKNRNSRRVSQGSHHRHRNESGKGSGNTEGESSASDNRARVERAQRRKAPSQKAMLSKALQKAHHAVTLDSHSNYEGAMIAYEEACALLQKVMIRSSGIEDRLKLEAVRNTYETRISELRGTDSSYQSADGKALPERPQARDSKESERLSIVTDTDEGEEGIVEMATATVVGSSNMFRAKRPHLASEDVASIPPRRQSLQPSLYKVEGREIRPSSQIQNQQLPMRSRYNTSEQILETHLSLQTPMNQEYMPPPLSPRRPLSPARPANEAVKSSVEPSAHSSISDESNQSDPVRQDNNEHTSWLITINESSGSSSSSVHSHRSIEGLRRKPIRPASGQTEADFDATLDAAFEAVYDDGFEPDDEEEDEEQLVIAPEYQHAEPEPLSAVRMNVELAKENVREAEREAAISVAKDRERQRLQGRSVGRDSIDMEYGDDEADEEERMLEEMTREYIMDDSEYDIQTKSALPRQSDSSGFSGRTWGSSIGSNPTSAGTSLSTVAESTVLPSMAAQLKDNPLPPPLHPPPSSALPPPPVPVNPTLNQQSVPSLDNPPSLPVRNTSPGVRDRRLSKARQLKIETNTISASDPESEAPKTQPPIPPPLIPLRTESPKSPTVTELPQTLPNIAFKPPPTSTTQPSSRKGSSPLPASDSTDPTSSTASALTKVTSADSDNSAPSMPGSPARFATKAATGLRKNFSSSSLRNKSLTVTVPDALESSTASLSSISLTPRQRKAPSPAMPVVPTPLETNFITKGQPMGGIYLFDSDIHAPNSPGSPNPLASNPPAPLESCPESMLLRPFWLLRVIYQTIAHPRGGYVSNRLFVPRDIWRVKNIKLKNLEEKVSSCDLLTAALLKLGKVDTLDANAVLTEMQFFESIMESVQASLTKKLGNDVGVQGAAHTFKGLNAVEEITTNPEVLTAKTTNANSRSYLPSWRKLRSRNVSGQGFPPSTSNTGRDSSREAPTMKSLPMTANQNPRFPKRDVRQVQCIGPNPSYMGALARLCDAAQILDQITRQVEDPGLKHSSQVHVGLELSARHAAEFFGFFVCRFILADIGIMLDKFIKRGSEWALA